VGVRDGAVVLVAAVGAEGADDVDRIRGVVVALEVAGADAARDAARGGPARHGAEEDDEDDEGEEHGE
jgi:hypothetical protein